MKIRQHRGSLIESMATIQVIEPTKEAIADYFSKAHNEDYDSQDIEVKPYGFDSRIDWDTHIVMIHNEPYGFTDQTVN